MENSPQPESLEERLARVEQENEILKEANALLIKQLEEAEEFKEKAYTDPLTGLKNRHALGEIIKLIFKPKREGGPENREVKEGQENNVCTIMVDIDHFKQVNDIHGHSAGDAVIKGVAQRLEGSIRETDFIARYGGEEFIIMLFEISEYEAQKKAERLRKLIEENPFDFEGKSIPVTISVGLSFGDKSSDPDTLTKEADAALYESKKSGRNQVTIFSSL